MKGGIDWIHVPLPFSLSHVLYPGSDSHSICWIPAGGGGGRYYMCYLPNLLK